MFSRTLASPCSLSAAVLILRLSAEPTEIRSSLDPWAREEGHVTVWLINDKKPRMVYALTQVRQVRWELELSG